MSISAPLTRQHTEDSLLAWTATQSTTHGQFIAHVLEVAEQLPEKQYIINLIENRYLFMVSFAAALIRKQVSLLPQSRAPENIADIASHYPDCYCLTETELAAIANQVRLKNLNYGTTCSQVPKIATEQIATISFTSGSTGKPKAFKKYWGDLIQSIELASERFKLTDKVHQIVATVPAQHMYGLETSVLYPMLTGCAIYGDRPFFPADINQIFNQIQQPGILVTTPVHLRACISANLKWRNIEFVISATSPLSVPIAQQAHETMDTRIQEIFGCTEAGSIASRETLNTDIWDVFSCFSLSADHGVTQISAPCLREPVNLHDDIKLINEHQFLHRGRNEDMINIGGKRGSLADLNLKLQALENVEAGTFFLPENQCKDQQCAIDRLMAFVVAPNIDEKEIINALAQKIDPVFLPRPLYKVDQLPYNETGKLTLEALNKLHQQIRQLHLPQN